MRPVSSEFRTSQPFGSMKTAGVRANSNPSSGVGYYVHLYGNYQPYGHAGCDIACPEGTPVHAIAAGTVLWADWGTKLPGDESNLGYRKRWYLYKGFPGIVTVIQHAGWIGVYAHLSAAHLNVGDKVQEGQLIGLSGGTGGVAPHLHVEALVDLNYTTGGGLIYGRTDPEPFFGSAAIAPQGTLTTEEDEDMAISDDDARKIARFMLDEVVLTEDQKPATLRWFLASERKARGELISTIVDGIFNRKIKVEGEGESGETSFGAEIGWFRNNFRRAQK